VTETTPTQDGWVPRRADDLGRQPAAGPRQRRRAHPPSRRSPPASGGQDDDLPAVAGRSGTEGWAIDVEL